MPASVRPARETTWNGSREPWSSFARGFGHRGRPRGSPLPLMGRPVAVASLADVIRSKEAANRAKDQVTLPGLRLLSQQLKAKGGDG